MKIFLTEKLVFLCLNLIFLSIAISSLNAQSLFGQNLNKAGKTPKKDFSELIRSKNPANPFKLIAPANSAVFAGENPCETLIPISVGETVGAALNDTDCRLEDGSYADFYSFSGQQGQQITILLESGSFDTYLGISNESGSFVVEDDDGGSNTDSRISVTLPETGLYIILANSVFADYLGGYVLKLSGSQPCTYSVSPTTASIPGVGGTYTFNVNTQPECHWQAYSISGFAATESRGIGPGIVTYTVDQNGSGEVRTGNIEVSSAPSITSQQRFTFTQESAACNYSLSPASVNIPATETSGSFQINTPAGCTWSVRSNSAFILSDGSGNGTGTITFTAQHNNGAARTATIDVGGKTFTINQAGLNCTFSLTPQALTVARNAAVRTVYLETQPNCKWSLINHSTWLEIQNTHGFGSRALTVNIPALTESESRSAALRFEFSIDDKTIYIDQSLNISTKPIDFDGDGKTDISIFRPNSGEWWYSRSSDNKSGAFQFGKTSDKIVPADYTGDGKTDIAFWRESTGEWFILRSEDNSFYSYPLGTSGDIPVAGDFDRDGKADSAVFRPSTASWYILRSSDGQVKIQQFGANGDVPVAADYDRDGRADIAIYRPTVGQWWIQRSSMGLLAVKFGAAGDIPAPGDYTGDNAADIAVFRPNSGEWLIRRSENGSYFSFPFGTAGDIAAPGDYDGDNLTDAAVFRASNSTWYINATSSGTKIISFGISGDIPLSNAGNNSAIK